MPVKRHIVAAFQTQNHSTDTRGHHGESQRDNCVLSDLQVLINRKGKFNTNLRPQIEDCLSTWLLWHFITYRNKYTYMYISWKIRENNFITYRILPYIDSASIFTWTISTRKPIDDDTVRYDDAIYCLDGCSHRAFMRSEGRPSGLRPRTLKLWTAVMAWSHWVRVALELQKSVTRGWLVQLMSINLCRSWGARWQLSELRGVRWTTRKDFKHV